MVAAHVCWNRYGESVNVLRRFSPISVECVKCVTHLERWVSKGKHGSPKAARCTEQKWASQVYVPGTAFNSLGRKKSISGSWGGGQGCPEQLPRQQVTVMKSSLQCPSKVILRRYRVFLEIIRKTSSVQWRTCSALTLLKSACLGGILTDWWNKQVARVLPTDYLTLCTKLTKCPYIVTFMTGYNPCWSTMLCTTHFLILK